MIPLLEKVSIYGAKYKIKKDDLLNYYNQCILLGTELFDKISNKYFKLN